MRVDTKPEDRAAVLRVISAALGAINYVECKTVAEWCAISPREVRQHVRDLRELGEPICSITGMGYYTPLSQSEKTVAIGLAQRRIEVMQRLIERLST